jgi:hypothetical protein
LPAGLRRKQLAVEHPRPAPTSTPALGPGFQLVQSQLLAVEGEHAVERDDDVGVSPLKHALEELAWALDPFAKSFSEKVERPTAAPS